MPQKVRTAFGNSEKTYRVSQILEGFNNNMQGLLQGNGPVPQMWYILSSVIFAALRAQGFGVNLSNSFTGELTKLLGFSYIDDYDIIQSSDDVNTTHQDMLYALLELEEFIKFTRGYLVPNKSAWYLVDY